MGKSRIKNKFFNFIFLPLIEIKNLLLHHINDTQDTDGDGLSDYDEKYNWLTDPLNPDMDSDGYLDGNEVKNGYDPLTTGNAKLK